MVATSTTQAGCRLPPPAWVESAAFLSGHDRWWAKLTLTDERAQKTGLVVMMSPAQIFFDVAPTTGPHHSNIRPSSDPSCSAGLDQALACLGLDLDAERLRAALFMDTTGQCLTGPAGLAPVTAAGPKGVIDYLDWMPSTVALPSTLSLTGLDARRRIRIDVREFSAQTPAEHHKPWPSPVSLVPRSTRAAYSDDSTRH